MSFFAACATMLASSSNCLPIRSVDSYSATAARRTSAPTATATVRPTRARRRLGARMLARNRTGPALKTGQDLLPFGTLHEVKERLDGRLRLDWIVGEVQGTTDGIRPICEGVTRRRDVVDREQPNVARRERFRIHSHHADRVLERTERL